MKPIKCYCGGTATLQSNATIYGREYGNGRAYVCENFQKCRGSVGSHNTGYPLGTIADPETKLARIRAHNAIDPLWKSHKYRRDTVYRRLSEAFGYSVHIGNASKEECEEIIKTAALVFSPTPTDDTRRTTKEGEPLLES